VHFPGFPVFIKGKVRNESLSLEATKLGFEIFKKAIAELSQNLVGLSSVEDEAFGEEFQVIWELEPRAYLHERMELPQPTGQS